MSLALPRFARSATVWTYRGSPFGEQRGHSSARVPHVRVSFAEHAERKRNIGAKVPQMLHPYSVKRLPNVKVGGERIASWIKTLCTLEPGSRRDGTRCLRGQLPRDVTTTDQEGNDRTYPAGTPIMLIKNRDGTYRLLAVLQDEDWIEQFELAAPPHHRQRRARGGVLTGGIFPQRL